MSLAGNVTDVRGVIWGKYVDESDGSCFYVNRCVSSAPVRSKTPR